MAAASASVTKHWIKPDETAKAFLGRVLADRPFIILPPPLHRLPLRAGNVVEISGPSPSAKSVILVQAAVHCILPKEWKGVHYGGLERAVMFIDLDCRFEVLILAQLLKQRIIDANGMRGNLKEPTQGYDEELFAVCMRRFLYISCYHSLEFLATLKTMHHKLQTAKEVQGVDVHLLMIDSIGAFYWMDRASASSLAGGNSRKGLSLQSISETVVQETQKLLLVHPILVLVTRTVASGDRERGKWSSDNALDTRSTGDRPQNLPNRDYMPSVWKSFVTHRVLLQPSEECQSSPAYLARWLLPSHIWSDKFIISGSRIKISNQMTEERKT